MALRTDYKDDLLDVTQNERRKYQMLQNSDGTVSFVDVSAYTRVGDVFGAGELNSITKEVNAKTASVILDSAPTVGETTSYADGTILFVKKQG